MEKPHKKTVEDNEIIDDDYTNIIEEQEQEEQQEEYNINIEKAEYINNFIHNYTQKNALFIGEFINIDDIYQLINYDYN